MRMSNAITTLVGEEQEGSNKYHQTLAAPNGSLYGLGSDRVAKFNPIDTSMTLIGPHLVDPDKWIRGAMTVSGIIYCPPYNSRRRGILKIDTNTDTVTELNANLLPERGDHMWESCALALDGCIYCMPSNARRIMKLDPNNGDAITSVGDDLGSTEYKYIETVVGIDGCVYGIPLDFEIVGILKYDTINDITFFAGEESGEYWECNNGAVERDGFIYVLITNCQVLKIDTCTTNNSLIFDVHSTQPGYGKVDDWGHAILGIDGCIYWPPMMAGRTLKYDPHFDQISLVGDDFGRDTDKWIGGTLALDGVIYCIPHDENQILAIDPMGEFLETTKAYMEDRPEEFGSLFQTPDASGGGSVLSSQTNFDHAVIKFGQKKVFEVLEKAMKPVNKYCKENNLCPFMIVASNKESTLCAINYLLRRDPSWVNTCSNS